MPDFEKSLSFMLGDLHFGTHLPEGVEILLGEYREIGKNHGKPVFRRSDAHHNTVATGDWFILDPSFIHNVVDCFSPFDIPSGYVKIAIENGHL